MKSEWKVYKLSDIADIFDSLHKTPEYVPKGISMVRVTDIKEGYLNLSSTLKVSSSVYKEFTKKYSPSIGDIVISRVGTYGIFSYVAQSQHFCLGQNTAIIHPKIENKFLYYSLLAPSTKQFLESVVTGSTQKTVSLKNIKAIPIALPSERTQKYIANILSTLDDKIELNQKINENLERQAQAIFSERFSGFSVDNLPDGWKAVRLGDVAVISNKSFNPITEPETLLEHYSIPAFDEARFPVFELSTSIKSNKFIVDADCFMISKLNPTTKRVWKPYCISDKAVCSTEFIVYKAREHRYTDFLYSLIDSESFSGFMCSHVTGSTGSRQRTAPSNTLQFEFALPPAEEISAFTSIVQPMYNQMRTNAIESDKLKRLRDILLPKLISGKIDVSDTQF